MDDDKKAYV